VMTTGKKTKSPAKKYRCKVSRSLILVFVRFASSTSVPSSNV
jgi:hypothetical protein